MRWYEDPKLARTLARATWPVLVGAFVVLTRSSPQTSVRLGAVAAMVAMVAVLNFPVFIGLARSRAEATTRAYRAVAAMLLLRLFATLFVMTVVLSV